MQDKRKKLMKLLTDLKLPIPVNEMNKHVEGLSNEEVDFLINKSQAIKDYQDDSEKLLSEVDSKKYKQIQLDYLEKVKQLEHSRLDEMESAQERVDDKLSTIEAQAEKEIDGACQKEKSELDRLQKNYQKFHSDAKTALQDSD
jgi:UDP-galactopyranose mutase